MNDEWPSEKKVVMSRIEYEYYLQNIFHYYPTKFFHDWFRHVGYKWKWTKRLEISESLETINQMFTMKWLNLNNNYTYNFYKLWILCKIWVLVFRLNMWLYNFDFFKRSNNLTLVKITQSWNIIYHKMVQTFVLPFIIARFKILMS